VACLNTSGGWASVSVGAESTSCQEQGGVAAFDPPAWSTRASFCPALAAEGDCTTGDCYERPGTGFVSGVCIWRTGDGHACPPEFPAGHTYYDELGISDDRGCSACSCAVTTVCNIRMGFHFNVTCLPQPAAYEVYPPNNCLDVNDPGSFGWQHSSSGTPPACSVSQEATITCSAVPDVATAITVCCG